MSTTNERSMTKSLVDDQKWLPEAFTPGKNDVLIGRGRVCYLHVGNKRLADIVQSMLGLYSVADSKRVRIRVFVPSSKDAAICIPYHSLMLSYFVCRHSPQAKSDIIFDIVTKVRESSPDGGFVKQDKSNGRYFEVGNHLAREKVSQTFRDALSGRYKSSTSAKAHRRKQERLDQKMSTRHGKQIALDNFRTWKQPTMACCSTPVSGHFARFSPFSGFDQNLSLSTFTTRRTLEQNISLAARMRMYADMDMSPASPGSNNGFTPMGLPMKRYEHPMQYY